MRKHESTRAQRRVAFAAAALALAALPAFAQATTPIYRCGNQYSQQPCPQGRVVDAGDPRSEAQRAEARRIAADERRLGARMERERRAHEAEQPPAAASGFDSRGSAARATAAASEPSKHAARGKAKHRRTASARDSDADFVAVDPASLKKRGRK